MEGVVGGEEVVRAFGTGGEEEELGGEVAGVMGGGGVFGGAPEGEGRWSDGV